MRIGLVLFMLILSAAIVFGHVFVDLTVSEDGKSCPCCSSCGCSTTIVSINWLPMFCDNAVCFQPAPEASGIVKDAFVFLYSIKPLRSVFHPPNTLLA
jgi:hypothetical protein